MAVEIGVSTIPVSEVSFLRVMMESVCLIWNGYFSSIVKSMLTLVKRTPASVFARIWTR